VKLVIADTGLINYLVLIGHIGILPALCEKVILPWAVRDELTDPDTPGRVRPWIATPHEWLKFGTPAGLAVARLGAGETEAITLAVEFHADLLLMDDRRGVKAARGKGIEVTGTLGVLSLAGKRGLVNLAEAFDRIKQTSFRFPTDVMQKFLDDSTGETE
jgi:predicted nucleic acid-binding protein